MIKLNNYRCPACDIDHEVWVDTEADDTALPARCPLCGYQMRPWNIKNNTQRYRFCDDYEVI